MGWSDYQDPAEVRAAAEAREKIEAQRIADDARNDLLSTAILQGFTILSDAVMAAAGLDTETRTRVLERSAFAGLPVPDEAPTGINFEAAGGHAGTWPAGEVDDPDMDELLDPPAGGPAWCPKCTAEHAMGGAECLHPSSPQTARGDGNT